MDILRMIDTFDWNRALHAKGASLFRRRCNLTCTLRLNVNAFIRKEDNIVSTSIGRRDYTVKGGTCVVSETNSDAIEH